MTESESKNRSGNYKSIAVSPVQIAVFLGLVLLIVLGTVGFFLFTLKSPRSTNSPSAAQNNTITQIATAGTTVTAGITPTTPITPVTTPSDTYTSVTATAPSWSDTLSSQDGNQWDEDTECGFSNGVYLVNVNATNFYGYCIESNLTFANFVYQVQMTIMRGDYGGIAFRESGPKHFFYARVGQDGSYGIYLMTGIAGNFGQELAGGSFSSLINRGLGQSNQIAIVAQGNSFDLYINRQFVAHATDNTFSSGYIGVIAVPGTSPTEVAFSNAQLWTL